MGCRGQSQQGDKVPKTLFAQLEGSVITWRKAIRIPDHKVWLGVSVEVHLGIRELVNNKPWLPSFLFPFLLSP